jgi:hypothetical protein
LPLRWSRYSWCSAEGAAGQRRSRPTGGPESGFTTEQIEGWSEFSWANHEYRRLDDLQESEMDPDKRAEYIHQIQEAMKE